MGAQEKGRAELNRKDAKVAKKSERFARLASASAPGRLMMFDSLIK